MPAKKRPAAKTVQAPKKSKPVPKGQNSGADEKQEEEEERKDRVRAAAPPP